MKGNSKFNVHYYNTSNLSHVTFDTILTQTFGKEYKIVKRNYVKGELIPYHCHNHPEIIYILDGEVRFIIEDSIVDVSTYDVLKIITWAAHMLCTPKCNVIYLHALPKNPKKMFLDKARVSI